MSEQQKRVLDMPRLFKAFLMASVVWVGLAMPVRAEVLLQYFETEWDEIYRRLPEISEIGYEGLWVPPPSKSPNAGGQFAGGGNVGYSHFDKFDIGDVPQRGSLGTRYGTRGSLRNLADNAHNCDIKVYPDIVMNHFGNGPDYRTYPGTRPNDFHGWWDGAQPGGFKRAPRMTAYDDVSNGYGGTFQQELVSLIDLQLEPDRRFIDSAPNYSAPPAFFRQPGQAEYYPYGYNSNESTVQFLNRWITWLGNAMDFDGCRFDAPKHVVADFFGTAGSGFNHEIQYNLDQRRGFTDGYTGDNEYNELYLNYVKRKDALIFGEMFIGSTSQVDYWRNFGVKMRYLDFPRKSSMIFPAFNNGNLAALSGFAGFSDAEGIVFCQSHDESPPSKLELAYAYSLLHVGLPVVFFTGNNLAGSDVNVKTWMKTGHGAALGDYNYNAIPNLVYIHNQFARGREWERWSEGDVYIFERYEDGNSSATPDSSEGLLLVGLNDSGGWQTRNGVQTAFAAGTVLKDYTGHNGSDLTVDGSGKVNLSIPPGDNGQGWVAYAPYNATANGTPIRFSPSTSMAWVVPGGSLTTSKTREVTRLTNDTVDIDVYFNEPAGVSVNNVVVKWGLGRNLNAGATDFSDPSLVIDGFEQATYIGAGHWRLTADVTGVPDGLHLIKARCFNSRPGGYPALFQTFQTSVYLDRHGPDLTISTPAASATVDGDVVAVISNSDRTAYQMNARVDGGGWQSVTEVQKGLWKVNLSGLGAGSHTMEVQALEADWAASRAVINTSTVSRTFTVDTNGPAVFIGFSGINNGLRPGNIELPFFTTTVTAPGASVKLYWDGYELPLSGTGPFTSIFDGRYVTGGQTNRLYGCFVNGTHFFEAVAVSGGLTNRVTQKVTFNLYGRNEIDSDGDGLPDNIEMPNFASGTAPGPNVPWPGDNNQDMIPNYGENWTRLNPMNADSDYDGTWDGDEDSDYNINSGDGMSCLCEVKQGYLDNDDPYFFNIYNGSSKPSQCSGNLISSMATWSPSSPTRCAGSTLTVTYIPNDGPLAGVSPIQIHIGYNNWTGTIDSNMTSIGNGTWQMSYAIPGTATNINFMFKHSSGTPYDNNGGYDWSVAVGACVVTTNHFTMDGQFDNAGYEVANNGMKILAAVKGTHLYAATWSARGGANDHILYVTDAIGAPLPAPWAKAGTVSFDKTTKPYLAVEQTTGAGYLNNGGTVGRNWIGANGAAMELEIDMEEVFGYVPDAVYIAAVAYGTADGGTVQSQCPPDWSGDSNLPRMEFQAIPVASIRDENLDGSFDAGKPQMWTVVNANTNDANYGLRRFFLDETMGESESITVILKPNIAGVSNVELFSNLNRRDFAVMPGDEDPATVTPTSMSTYYRAYPMSDIGGGQYAVTVPVNRCGVYRLNARYTVGAQTRYYTDNGLRRDCAVVVSPKKARDLRLYELNPMTAEATDDTFYGRSTFSDLYTVNSDRPDIMNTNYFRQLGANMIWLQPVHPIGSDNRQTDPSTGAAFDPGSPYAVRNYWQVNSVLGDPATPDRAMLEFTNFVHAMQLTGVGVMLDGTFNHSAWDCEVGNVGQSMFPAWATNATALIRDARPQWYSRKGDHAQHASYYVSAADNDIAQAPDRSDFGKWSDAADFNYGVYDSLVGAQTDAQRDNYLDERDVLSPLDAYHREVWRYFAAYPAYWLEKTGCPAGTPKLDQAQVGIAGLRCDFAQGLPSQFWEYTINKTRSIKWDFVFMAESLDGYRTVNGSNRHGVGYRSARQFDVLNENLVFYWRDQFFSYNNLPGANPATAPTWSALDNRRNAYDVCPLLLNLTTHDELLPSDSQWRVLYAYAELAGIDGAPLLFYGQEAGMQNDAATYTNRGINAQNNFARYETNFGKSIPNFKRYNAMSNVWANLYSSWKTPLLNAYQRINAARRASPALRSPENYFLSKQVGGGYDADIFAVAKYLQPGASVASQEVVLVFVNNNYEGSTNRSQVFSLNATYAGRNWFGIIPDHSYNIVDLISTTPATLIWGTDRTGTDLINNGIYVGLNGNPFAGQQAQFLKLIDRTQSSPDTDGDGLIDAVDPDKDNDTLPDVWEVAHSLNALVGTGDDGPDGDPDHDGMSNYQEFLAGTQARNAGSVFRFTNLAYQNGNVNVDWSSIPGINYMVEATTNLVGAPMQPIFFGTASGVSNRVTDIVLPTAPQRFYRARVIP